MAREFLLYIGNSNKEYTHNRVYRYDGVHPNRDDARFFILIYTNKNKIITLGNEYKDYFFENFKLIDENELNRINQNQNRRSKLNNLKKKK